MPWLNGTWKGNAWLWVLAALCCVSLSAHADRIEPYQILATELPPFSTTKTPNAPGALAEMAEVMASRMGIAANTQFFPWSRAQALTQKQTRTVVLPLTRTPEREPQYTWMVKLYHQDFVFIALAGSGLDLDSVDAMRSKRIAALRGSPNVVQLRERQFQRILETDTVDEQIKMLQLHLVDAMCGSEAINLSVIDQKAIPRSSLRVGKPYMSGEIWLGGSPDLTDEDARNWQNAMQKIVADGTYAKILAKYRLKE